MSIPKFSSLLRIVQPGSKREVVVKPPTSDARAVPHPIKTEGTVSDLVRDKKPKKPTGRVPVIADAPDENTTQCDWCGVPFYPVSNQNKFCTKEHRVLAESKRRRAARAERDNQAKVREAPPALLHVAETAMDGMASEAKCSEPDSIRLPWTSLDVNNQDARKMLNLCLECPLLGRCAMYAQESGATGTWGAALLNNGRAVLWMCPNCHDLNEGSFDVCSCKKESIPFRARATVATREGRNITPRRQPYGLGLPQSRELSTHIR